VWWSITEDHGLSERDVELAEEISAVAPDLGVPADRRPCRPPWSTDGWVGHGKFGAATCVQLPHGVRDARPASEG
jgi:hypothetical protein